MTLHWTVLGAGAILPRAGFGCSGHALRTRERGPVTLFDCGPGSVRKLGDVGIGVEEIERVVLSHFHTDHCLDLLALAFARRSPSLAGRLPALEIVGPRGTAALVERGAAFGGERGWTRFTDARIVEVDPHARGATLAAGDLELAWTATQHTEHAVAWRVRGPCGATLVYSGDTGENEDVAALAREADLFVCECSFPDEAPVARHLTPSSAARLARAAGAHRLLLTHFYPSVAPDEARRVAARTFPGPIEASYDGWSGRVARASP